MMNRRTEANKDVMAANDDSGFCPVGSSLRRKLTVRGVLAAAAVAVLPQFVMTQAVASSDFPNKPVRLVIPYGTGGVSDSIGRVVATAMSKALGQTVYVENRGGAGGMIGAAAVSKAEPDGYTILLTSPPMVAVAPVLMSNLSYDNVDGFTPIGTLVTTPNILVVNPSLPVKTIPELIAYAKGEGKGKLSFASAGPGSTGHLSGHILMTSTGIDMAHIPYKSSGMAFPDVISGRVSMVFDSLPSTISHVTAGNVRPIAVMSAKRSELIPDVQTATEAGFPKATMNFWMGLEGPAKMPPAVVQKLSDALKAAVASPEMRKQLATLGADPHFTTSKEFDALRSESISSLGKLVADMGLGKK
jgi:tripartite-type tricarboxylate transporter receptor subunit TctC